MLFVAVGVAFIALHFLGIGAPARWNWEPFGDLWKFLMPFGLALAWWSWSDASGRTAQRAMEVDAERKAERKRRTAESLGLGTRRSDAEVSGAQVSGQGPRQQFASRPDRATNTDAQRDPSHVP